MVLIKLAHLKTKPPTLRICAIFQQIVTRCQSIDYKIKAKK